MNIYEIITSRIIEEIEKNNVLPWQKEWKGLFPVNHSTQKPYRGINLLLLPQTESNEFITWSQLCDLRKKDESLKLKKGSKQHLVVFFNTYEDKLDEEKIEKKGYLKYYKLFAIEDVENLAPKRVLPNKNNNPHEDAETLIDAYLSKENIRLVTTCGDKACYSPTLDQITIPKLQAFNSSNFYYETLLHECVHSSGHPNRLNRLSKDAYFGNDIYSREELTAQLGASFLCNHLGLETEKTFNNSAAYIKSWLRVLNSDKTFVYRASTQAQKAVDYILNAREEISHEA
jgi:antirestriction protein ArdC